jgi:hypothetical protein
VAVLIDPTCTGLRREVGVFEPDWIIANDRGPFWAVTACV